MTSIAQRYQIIVDKIKQTELKYEREPGSVTLVAVSKTKPAQMIREMAELGQYTFGENYLQEAVEKQDQLSDLGLEWHFIGHIQSNKTKIIAEHFNWVHGVDRFKITQRLNEQRPPSLPPVNICLQVNLEGEVSKSGVNPAQVKQLATKFMHCQMLNCVD